LRSVQWWLAWAVLAGCAPEQEDELALDRQEIVYGRDDRLDVYEHPDPILRGVAQNSVVSLVPRARIRRSPAGEFVIATQPLEQAFTVCEDERFATQPTAAECSGVLIDDDLVLTAGHCFTTDEACSRYAFMFDYFLNDATHIEPISWGDIYGCRRVIKRIVSPDPTQSPRIDYAVVQLDRPAVGRTPATPRLTPLNAGEPLATLGSASGLPTKIDSGAHVLATRSDVVDYFLLDSDTFQGSSGSGVFDVNGALVGVLVRGGEDYMYRGDESCRVPKVVSWPLDASAPRSVGEEATYLTRALQGLCSESQWPSQRLCGTAKRCGDGICSAGESLSSCAADCACTGDECPQQANLSAGDVVARPKSAEGCALGSRQDGSPLLLLALAAWLRRRRR
jgi:hypothetical protein